MSTQLTDLTHEGIVKIAGALLSTYCTPQPDKEQTITQVSDATGAGRSQVNDVAFWLGMWVDKDHDADIDYSMDLDQWAAEMLEG